MKKTFKLTDPKKKTDRIADQIRSEVKRYIKRERNKELPAKVDFWDFDCRFGKTEASAETIHLSKINEHIAQMVSIEASEFYLEILSKPGIRTKKKAENVK